MEVVQSCTWNDLEGETSNPWHNNYQNSPLGMTVACLCYHLLHFIASNLILNIFGQHMSKDNTCPLTLHGDSFYFLALNWTWRSHPLVGKFNLQTYECKKKNCAGSHRYSPGFLHADKYCAQFFLYPGLLVEEGRLLRE